MCIDSNAASSLFLLSANYFTYPALPSVCIDIRMGENILSGGGVKQLCYATNNKVPHQSITLNLMRLVLHTILTHIISQNFSQIQVHILSDPSHLYFSLPLIKTQCRSTITHSTFDLPSPNDDPLTTGSRKARSTTTECESVR